MDRWACILLIDARFPFKDVFVCIIRISMKQNHGSRTGASKEDNTVHETRPAMIKTVGKRLAMIGDELNKSFQVHPESKIADPGRFPSSSAVKRCIEILSVYLKTSTGWASQLDSKTSLGSIKPKFVIWTLVSAASRNCLWLWLKITYGIVIALIVYNYQGFYLQTASERAREGFAGSVLTCKNFVIDFS